MKKNEQQKEELYFISVVNDLELYKKCITANPFVINSKGKITCLNNIGQNKAVSVLYNSFLDTYDYSKEAWLIFCHNDWELLQDINPILAGLDKNNLYGPIGIRNIYYNNKILKLFCGSCFEEKRDGTSRHIIGNPTGTLKQVDTFDCQCLIVHSSLVKKYNLRFDDKLVWHLYVEDFCINAFLSHNIKSYVVGIKCCHHSDAGYSKTVAPEYMESLEYLNEKYPNDIFAGVITYIGGKKQEKCTPAEIIRYKMKKPHLDKGY